MGLLGFVIIILILGVFWVAGQSYLSMSKQTGSSKGDAAPKTEVVEFYGEKFEFTKYKRFNSNENSFQGIVGETGGSY